MPECGPPVRAKHTALKISGGRETLANATELESLVVSCLPSCTCYCMLSRLARRALVKAQRRAPIWTRPGGRTNHKGQFGNLATWCASNNFVRSSYSKSNCQRSDLEQMSPRLLDECQSSFERLLSPPAGLDDLEPEARTIAEVRGWAESADGNRATLRWQVCIIVHCIGPSGRQGSQPVLCPPSVQSFSSGKSAQVTRRTCWATSSLWAGSCPVACWPARPASSGKIEA